MAGTGDRIGRWIRHSRTGQYLGAHIGALYIRLILLTTRWEKIGEDNYAAATSTGLGLIAAIWHGRLFLSPCWPPPGRRTVAMISNNLDGDLIAGIVWRFGVFSVRGSTYDHEKGRDKGGAEAFKGAFSELENHSVVAITPDGPRGPRMRAQAGAAVLSIQTGIPVVPVAFSTVRGKVLRNWDRFLIPFPFGRGVQIFGEPLSPPPADTHDPGAVEAFRVQIETALTHITQEADRLCGREPVEPVPVMQG